MKKYMNVLTKLNTGYRLIINNGYKLVHPDKDSSIKVSDELVAEMREDKMIAGRTLSNRGRKMLLMGANIMDKIAILNKRKPTHDNYQKIDIQLTKLGFDKKKSFFDSGNGTFSSVDDGGIWENGICRVTTHYVIDYHPYNPKSLSVTIEKI